MLKLVDKPMQKLGAEGGKALKQLIDCSIEKDNDYFRFHTNLRYYLSGEHWKNLKGRGKDQLRYVVNLVHAHVRSLVPTLYFQNPTVDSVPTSPLHAGKENTWNSVFNNTMDKIGFKKEMKALVLDAALYPEAVMKDVLNVVDEETSEQGRSGPTEWLSKGSPAHIRLSPTQLIVDYLVKDRNLDNARFIAIRYRRPMAEMKAHPIYGKNINLTKAQVSTTPTTGNLVGKQVDKNAWDDESVYKNANVDEEMVTFYETWIHQLITDGNAPIKCYQQMCVLMEGQDEPIRELEDWDEVMGEGFNKYPITRIVLNPVPDTLPVAEAQTWQGMQVALNWTMSRITQLIENDRLIYMFDPSKIKNFAKFKEQFYNGRSREMAEITEAGAGEILQPTFVGRDNYSLIQLLERFIQQVSGQGQNRKAGSGIRTASEAHIIEAGTQIKTDEKVDTISTFLVDVISKMAIMIRHLAKQTQGQWVFRRSGDLGSVQWVYFNSEDIDWLPEIRIRVNSFRKQDGLQDMQKFAGLIQTGLGIANLYGPGAVRVDILYTRMLEAAGISDASKIVGDADAQAKLQMAEIAGMIAGVQVPVNETDIHPVHIQGIDGFMNSSVGIMLMQKYPEMADILAQHRQWHIEKMQEQQQASQSAQISQQNPWQGVDSGGGTVQSEANTETAGSRTAMSALPGGQGAYA